MTRGLGRGFAEGWQGREIMEAIERARKLTDAELPQRDKAPEQLRAPGAVVDLLRTLLRLKAEQAGVAARLVANADELDRLVEAGPWHDLTRALRPRDAAPRAPHRPCARPPRARAARR